VLADVLDQLTDDEQDVVDLLGVVFLAGRALQDAAGAVPQRQRGLTVTALVAQRFHRAVVLPHLGHLPAVMARKPVGRGLRLLCGGQVR
jgi:hypothetical protein